MTVKKCIVDFFGVVVVVVSVVVVVEADDTCSKKYCVHMWLVKCITHLTIFCLSLIHD